MCSIFGMGLLQGHKLKNIAVLRELVTRFMHDNVIGGRTASGLSINSMEKFAVLKRPLQSTDLVRTEEYDTFIDKNLNVDKTISIVGHCRLKTKGSELNNVNNHPIVHGDVIGVHNGMIGNDDKLFEVWKRVISRNGEVDSEIIFALINYFAFKGVSTKIHNAIIDTSGTLNGSFACAMVHRQHPCSVWIFRRNAPQTILLFKKYGIVMWSTHKGSILSATGDIDFGEPIELDLKPNTGMGINLFNKKIHRFSIRAYGETKTAGA